MNQQLEVPLIGDLWRLTPDLRLTNNANGISIPWEKLVDPAPSGLALLVALTASELSLDIGVDSYLALVDAIARPETRVMSYVEIRSVEGCSRKFFELRFEAGFYDDRRAKQYESDYGAHHEGPELVWMHGCRFLITPPVLWTPTEILQSLESIGMHVSWRDAVAQFIADASADADAPRLFPALCAEWLSCPWISLNAWADSSDDPSVTRATQPKQKRRRPIPTRLRFEILHRAGHTCQSCGAKASDGAQLHIDHIHPVSKGGTNDLSNLQALCRDCNLGKGDRIL